MALKINPTTGKLDFYTHPGIATFKFIGFTTQAVPLDPGSGNMALNNPGGLASPQLVVSRTDKNGHDLLYSFSWFALGMIDEYYVLFWVNDKNDPSRYYGLLAGSCDTITDVGGAVVGFYFDVGAYFSSFDYNAVTLAYTARDIPDNAEVIMAMDLVFNPSSLGGMATQAANSVSISGGSISNANIWTPAILEIPVKTSTGDPTFPGEGRLYVNTFDKLVRLYADGAWRTILDFS